MALTLDNRNLETIEARKPGAVTAQDEVEMTAERLAVTAPIVDQGEIDLSVASLFERSGLSNSPIAGIIEAIIGLDKDSETDEEDEGLPQANRKAPSPNARQLAQDAVPLELKGTIRGEDLTIEVKDRIEARLARKLFEKSIEEGIEAGIKPEEDEEAEKKEVEKLKQAAEVTAQMFQEASGPTINRSAELDAARLLGGYRAFREPVVDAELAGELPAPRTLIQMQNREKVAA